MATAGARALGVTRWPIYLEAEEKRRQMAELRPLLFEGIRTGQAELLRDVLRRAEELDGGLEAHFAEMGRKHLHTLSVLEELGELEVEPNNEVGDQQQDG